MMSIGLTRLHLLIDRESALGDSLEYADPVRQTQQAHSVPACRAAPRASETLPEQAARSNRTARSPRLLKNRHVNGLARLTHNARHEASPLVGTTSRQSIKHEWCQRVTVGAMRGDSGGSAGSA